MKGIVDRIENGIAVVETSPACWTFPHRTAYKTEISSSWKTEKLSR